MLDVKRSYQKLNTTQSQYVFRFVCIFHYFIVRMVEAVLYINLYKCQTQQEKQSV